MPDGFKLSEKEMLKIEKEFGFHPLKEGQIDRLDEIRGAFKGIRALIMLTCPDSKERVNALTKLRESIWWALDSIRCNE